MVGWWGRGGLVGRRDWRSGSAGGGFDGRWVLEVVDWVEERGRGGGEGLLGGAGSVGSSEPYVGDGGSKDPASISSAPAAVLLPFFAAPSTLSTRSFPTELPFSTTRHLNTTSTPTNASAGKNVSKYPQYSYKNPPTTGPRSSPILSDMLVYPIAFPKCSFPTVSRSRAAPTVATMAVERPSRRRAKKRSWRLVPRAKQRVEPKVRRRPRMKSVRWVGRESERGPMSTVVRGGC